MVSQTIQAIETNYAGCRFRSRLEARWAVFFDSLGVKWTYEPEGFQLPSGRYLPDFWIPSLDMWIEVKPYWESVEKRDKDRCRDLAVLSGKSVMMVFSEFEQFSPREWIRQDGASTTGAVDPHSLLGCFHGWASDGWVSGAWCFSICECGKLQAGWLGKERDCHKGEDGDESKLLAAFSAAQSSRFEFGESRSRAKPNKYTSGDFTEL